MRRIALTALIALAVLLATVLAASQWLLRTESGAAWLWERTTAALSPSLAADDLSGSIRHGLRLRGLRYTGPGVRVDAADVRVSFDPDLWPLALTVEGLSVEGGRIHLLPETPEAAGQADAATPLRLQLAKLELPLLVRARDLRFADTRIIAADGTELLAVDALELTASLHERLIVNRLQLAMAGSEVRLDGQLALQAPYAVDASLSAMTTLVTGDDRMPLELALKLRGNLERLRADLASEQPSLNLSGSIEDVGSEPEFNFTGGSARLQWPPGSGAAEVALSDLALDLSGTLQRYQVGFRARLTTDSTGTLQLDGDLAGDLRGLQVSRLEVRSDDIDADLRGEFAWADGLRAAAEIDLLRAAPARWIAAWPDAQTVSGRVDGSWSPGGVELRELQLQHDASEASLSANGTIDVASEAVDLSLEWRELQWPLAPAQPTIDSRSAALNVSGDLGNWQLSGDVALGAPDLPQGRFTLTGNGTRDEVALSITDSAVLDGRVTGTVAFNWRGAQPWSAALRTENVSITPLVSRWPGRLSTNFNANGQLQPLVVEAVIHSLSGEVRSRPVSASGRLRLAEGTLRADGLRVQSGESSLSLDGSPVLPEGLRFGLQVASLADVLPGAAGEFSAEGSVRAGDELPLVTVSAGGTDLAWQGVRIGKLTLSNDAASTAEPLALEADLRDVLAGGREFTSLDLQLAGSIGTHRLAAAAATETMTAKVSLEGAASVGTPGGRPAWTGSVRSLQLGQQGGLSLSLRQPVALAANREAVAMTRACLDTSAGGALCSLGEWQRELGYRAVVEMTSLPLDLLRMFVNSELEFTQTLDGTVELRANELGRLSGNGRIEVAPGLIRNQYDERLNLRTRTGLAAFQLQDGQLLSGEIRLPFSDAAEISGNFKVDDVSLGPASPVTGLLRASVRDIGVGARIVPMIDAAGGSLEAEFRASGTLDAPVFDGGLSLRDGHFAYDPLGFRIDELEVNGEIVPGNRIELQSTFRAGEGRARVSSSADYLEGQSAGFELSLEGNQLTLIDLKDLRVIVDPDLQLGVTGDNLRINGRVVVPEARLASINLVDGGVNESDDVVIVGDAEESGDPDEQQASAMRFDGTVELVLGDRVTIDLDVAEARLRGSTRFTWNGPAVPQATGGFDLSGKFQAYGQLLEITEGIIRYPGVPADNPELRIRAEREIFGNSQVRSAGVLVSGTAQRPQVDVYTTPATTKDRALTLLATGSDFNYEQGVGAVDVGTYIAPKLYASYGIGLFDKDNVISVRYDLAKGFGIKATSGRRAAGIDISYTIER